MWTDILTALALVLVIEGLLPFISPNAFRSAMQSIVSRDNNTMRIIGLSSMIAGVLILTLVR